MDETTRKEQISMLAEISGLSCDAAKDALAMCDYNFNAAVNILFDDQANGASASTSNDVVASSSNAIGSTSSPAAEEFVREPIPPKRETLVTPDSDNFQNRRRRIVASRTICPLRNFELEGRLQEQQMEALSMPGTGKRKRDAETCDFEPFGRVLDRKSRLEYLYRPPVDICFSGSLQAARDFAKIQNRWLLVNLQDNSDFQCQILNRDLWSSEDIRSILKENFIFWQVAIDNSEGMRFQSFYRVQSFPFVCILDPTTGEQKISYTNDKILVEQPFKKELRNFLATSGAHPSPTDTTASSTSYKLSSTSPTLVEPSVLSEEDQIALAIANSLRDSESTSDSPDNSNADANRKSDSEGSKELNTDYEQLLGSSTDEITRLQLRLPNGSRTCLEWPCTTKLLALKRYINQKYPEIPPNDFKIICPFASKSECHIDLMNDNGVITLKEADLHPSAIIHIQIGE